MLAGGAAVAASGTLTYRCTTNLNGSTYDFGAVVDTNAPATIAAGKSATLTMTTNVALPDTLTTYLRTTGVTNVSGFSQTAETVDGVSRTVGQTIARTTVPGSGSLHVVGTGPGGPIKGGLAGTTISIGTGNLTATLTGYDDAGNVKLPSTGFTCTLAPAGQNLQVDTVAVVSLPTSTALKVRVSPIEYGTSAKVSVNIAQVGGSKPDGTITLTTNGQTVTAPVPEGRAKVSLPPALKMGTNQVAAVFTPADKNLASSPATVSYSVVRGTSTTTTLITFRDTRHKLVGTSLVTAVNGTDVNGAVRFTLLRDGARIRTATVSVTRNDRAKAAFERIKKPGTYVLKTKYLGSSTLRRSSTQVKLRINRPSSPV